MKRTIGSIFSLLILSFLASFSPAQNLLWLGSMGTPYAEAHGVSSDGTAVAGWAGVSGPHRAFRWTPATGMEDLGALSPGRDAEAWGMSANGQVVVGYSFVGSTGSIYRGFRWQNGEMEAFGTFGGQTSWAYDASETGTVIVGAAQLSDGFNRAFRWTQETGMVNLGTLPGAIRSVARAVSLDGNVVVGWSGFANTIHHAFRWENGQMTDIHNPAFGQSEAIGVSGDGNVVVGAWGDPSFTPARAFRWTAGTGMQDLGTLGGAWSEAWAADLEGTLVVGWAERSTGNWGAFRWTPQRGMEDLNTVYAHLLSPGSVLRWASAISPNGRYIAGNGDNAQTGRTEAFLIDTWEPFLPQNFTLLRGFVRAGGLSDLFQSDNQYLRLIPGFVLNQAEAPIQVDIQGTAPVNQPLQVTLVWEVAGNVPNVEERVELYNFNTGQWDLVNTQIITQQDTHYEVSLRLSGYVSSSREVRARLSHRALGLVLFYPWEVRLDEASFALIR